MKIRQYIEMEAVIHKRTIPSDLSEYMSKSQFGFMLRDKDIKTIVANLNYISKIEFDKIFDIQPDLLGVFTSIYFW